MIKFSRCILLILVSCITFSGCSPKTNITNGSISKTQDKSIIRSNENKVAAISINEIPSLKEGTRVEIDWAFPYIRYIGRSYKIAVDKAVEKEKVGMKIGKVERFIPSSMVITNKPFIDKDGDSNYLTEGSLIYEFEGKDVKEAIIIDDKGVFKEAIPYEN